jgi:hypothetical protein
MSEPYPSRSATEEDVQRLLGSRKALIAFPVGSEDDEDEDPIFASPNVPGRMRRGASTPPPSAEEEEQSTDS